MVIATRLTESEYADIMLRIADDIGEQQITLSEYTKQALLNATVVVVDTEVEQYKVFILSKLSNNINQIAKRLNKDKLSNTLNHNTYQFILNELIKTNQAIYTLSNIIRE